jgi:hypothetical protein
MKGVLTVLCSLLLSLILVLSVMVYCPRLACKCKADGCGCTKPVPGCPKGCCKCGPQKPCQCPPGVIGIPQEKPPCQGKCPGK